MRPTLRPIWKRPRLLLRALLGRRAINENGLPGSGVSLKSFGRYTTSRDLEIGYYALGKFAAPSAAGRLSIGMAFLLVGCGAADETPRQASSEDGPDVTAISPTSTITNSRLQTFAYTCGDDYVVTQLADDGSLWVFLPDQTTQLPHVPAASGVEHSDGTITFWSKANEALLNRGFGDTRCVEDPARSITEDAKLRGVDFRGTGNEPPWILEIGPDSIVVYTGYESVRNAFPLVEPSSDEGPRSSTWLSTSSEGTSVRLRVYQPPAGGRCQDTMADRTYESHVEIAIGDQLLRGCGDSLH